MQIESVSQRLKQFFAKVKEGRIGGMLPTWLVPSAQARIAIIYRWQQGRWPDLRHPQLFTEHVQRRKLRDRSPRLIDMCDKVRVKDIVKHRLGDDWVTPTLWCGEKLPLCPPASFPFVVKARHGCGQTAFVRSQADWQSAQSRARAWMQRPYGRWLDEWAYAHVPRGILIEPMLGDGIHVPVDYKFIVIGGHVVCIEVHFNRDTDHHWIVVDRDWQILSTRHPDRPEPPTCLAAMIAGAERLGAEYGCIRVDLYAIDGRPVFGELTCYPGSGVLPIDPPTLDASMGAAWTALTGASRDYREDKNA